MAQIWNFLIKKAGHSPETVTVSGQVSVNGGKMIVEEGDLNLAMMTSKHVGIWVDPENEDADKRTLDVKPEDIVAVWTSGKVELE